MANQLVELCYNVPDAPIYGQFVRGSLVKWFEYMQKAECVKPHIFDIGSGSGVTLCTCASFFHEKVKISGIEMCKQRVELSKVIIPQRLPQNVISWSIHECDVLTLSSLPPDVTHCISFDKTFPQNVLEHVERLQYACPALLFVTSCHRKPYNNTKRWKLLAKIPSHQHGSNCSITVYVHAKIVPCIA
jgi:hypothetical protein